MNIESTENELIKAVASISAILKTNNHYTYGLAKRIEATGKAVNDLTIGELSGLDAAHKHYFNQNNDEDSQGSISLDDLLNQQDQQRGFDFIPLESQLLLKRVKDGGHSGEFLADAFISSYRKTPFDHGLGEIIKLDTEAIRLFHEILHIRHVSGWTDNALYELEQQIIALNEVAL